MAVEALGVSRPGRTQAPARVYRRRHPERTALYRLVQQHLETWLARGREANPDGDPIPSHVERELRSHLECGVLACGFARAYCDRCGHVFPRVPVRQWAVTFPKRLRYFLHRDPWLLGGLRRSVLHHLATLLPGRAANSRAIPAPRPELAPVVRMLLLLDIREALA